MQDLINFINNHFIFILIWFLILFYILVIFISNLFNKKLFIDHNKFINLLNKHDAIIFDVRSSDEYLIEHFPKSINVNISNLNQINFDSLLEYKHKLIILVCSTGNLSFNISKILKKNGFLKIYILDGGILSWKNLNLPLIDK